MLAELVSLPKPAVNTVTLHTLNDFPSAHLNNERNIHVVLPPRYAQEPRKCYPVLYLNDGQDLHALRVRPTLQRLYDANALQHLIVVAVPTNHDRLNEYGTAHMLDFKGRGARAHAYTRFITEEVLPEIQGLYRTKVGPQHTACLGASLGGLSAFDIAWNYPHLFGICGVFSGSFWWRADSKDVQTRTLSRITHEMVRDSARTHSPANGRFWFQAGTEDEKEDRDHNGVIDAIQDTTELMDELALKGYRPGTDMVYVEVKGGQHHPNTWAEVLGEFLQFAFGHSRETA